MDKINKVASCTQLEEARQKLVGKKGVLMLHAYENRKARRGKEVKAMSNNRKNPNKRARVFYKMAHFALSMQALKSGYRQVF